MIYFNISGSTATENERNAVKSMLLAVLTMRETVILRIVAGLGVKNRIAWKGYRKEKPYFF